MEALSLASDAANSQCDLPLKRMPRYFMAVHIANHFAQRFRDVGYRIGASVLDTLANAGIDEDEIDCLSDTKCELPGNRRFDLVLRMRRKGVSSHVIQFRKRARSGSLFMNLLHLAEVSRSVGAASEMNINYLVVTTRMSKEQLEAMLATEEADHYAIYRRSRNRVNYPLKRYQQISHWAKNDEKEKSRFMAVAVFEVSYR